MTISTIEPQEGPGAELELTGEPLGSRLQRFAQDARAAFDIAQQLAPTPFVPTSMKRHGDRWLENSQVAQIAAAAMLAGDEIGLSPMQALAAIDVIEGKPSLNALAQRALVQAHGHEVWIHERHGGERRGVSVTVRGRRKGSDHVAESTWSWDRATQARLTGKKNWTDNPEAMCYARASAEVCRQIAADVLMGLAYTAEELADGEDGGADAVRIAVRRPEQSEEPRREGTAEDLARREEQQKGEAPEAEPAADTEPETQPEEEPICGEPKSEEPTKICSRPFGHSGRHHFGKEISAEQAAERQEAAEPEPLSQPEETEPALREGIADPEAPKRCPYYSDGAQCELDSRHEGAHRAGDRSWGGEEAAEAPRRCSMEHPTLGRCSLLAGHEGEHKAANDSVIEEPAAEPEQPEQQEELFEEPADAELEAALEADRAAAAEAAAEPEPTPEPEPAVEEDPDDPWSDFK